MLVVHCSDTPSTMDIGAADIKRWHTLSPPKGNGWSDIGYHFVIRRDGTLETGRPVNIAGSHVKGFNSKSIGICVVGRGEYEQAQIDMLIGLLHVLKERYNIALGNILGHYELDKHKTCPVMKMAKVRRSVQEYLS